MQNQEFSEEYYKMKYFKYRAKYEQLKEIAQARSGVQAGGASIMTSLGLNKPQSTLNPNAPSYIPGQVQGQVPNQGPNQDPNQVAIQDPNQPQPSRTSYFSSALKAVGMDKDSRNKRADDKQQKAETTKEEATILMKDIKEFVRENLEKKNNRKYLKTIGKLEEPSSYKQLVSIVDNINVDLHSIEISTFKNLGEANTFIQAETKKISDKKQEIISRINKQCATTIGGINAICKYYDEEDVDTHTKSETKGQGGGYTLTPDSLDDINTEF